jgi:hypothetical protein
LRSGVFCPYWGNEEGLVALDFDGFIIPSWWCWSMDVFRPSHVPEERGKRIDAHGYGPFLYLSMGEGGAGESLLPHEYTQIEIVGGVGGTLRVGFNPGELLDFILGWTTVDIFNDDLEAKKQKDKPKAPDVTARKPALEPGRSPTPSDLPDELRADVTMLASQIGERNCYRPDNLEAAASWIEQQFAATGLQTRRLPVNVPAGPPYDCGKMRVWNIEAEKRGGKLANKAIIIGAHYDSRVATPGWRDHKPLLKDRKGTPGANDNASGVAATLALARMLAHVPTERTIRFVAFVNEEPPFFLTDTMGSRIYARSCAEDRSLSVVGMISPETLGCYSIQSRKKRMRVAGLFGLPDRPDYIAFLSNRSSREFCRACVGTFRKHSPMAARTLALPAVCRRMAWSDDWSFWQEGIPAFTVTDTAWLRHDDYHELTDTTDRLDYAPMADVVWGLQHVVEVLANPDALPDCGTRAEGVVKPSRGKTEARNSPPPSRPIMF